MARRFGKLRSYRGGRSLDRPDVSPASGRGEERYEMVEPEFGFPQFIPVDSPVEHIFGADCWCSPAQATEAGKGPLLVHFDRGGVPS